MNENQLKGRLLALELRKEEAKSKVKRAIAIMFAIAGFQMLFALFYWIQTKSVAVFVVTLLIGIIIFGLALGARKKPLVPLIVALILLALLYSADLIFATKPNIIVIVIAVKLVIILFLILGIYNIYNAKKISKQYNVLSSKLNEVL